MEKIDFPISLISEGKMGFHNETGFVVAAGRKWEFLSLKEGNTMKNFQVRIVSLAMLFLIMNVSLVYGQQIKLWGSQKEGTVSSGPVQNGNTIQLTGDARIVGVLQDADSMTVFRNGDVFVTVQKGRKLIGTFPPGEYKLRTSIGSASIQLDMDFQAENIILWGRQNALVKPRQEGNIVVLSTAATIIEVTYDGTDGMGLFRINNDAHRAFLHFTSPYNLQNPGPKVTDITGAVVGKTLVGLTLPAGVYTLTPGRRSIDGIVFGQVVLNAAAAAGAPAPGSGWEPVASGGNRVDVIDNDICIDAMQLGKGFAAKRRPYDFSQDYTIEFDFQLREKSNHWLILYSDTFVHLHIDWGTGLYFLGPSKTKIMNMEVGRWSHIKLAAYPARNSFDIYIDGNQVGTGKNVKPGSMDVGPVLGTSGTDGAIGEWVYVGDFENTAYNRGAACWKNITLSYAPTAPAKPPAVDLTDPVNEAGAFLTSEDYVQRSEKLAGDGTPDWCFPIRLIGTGTVADIRINNISGQYSIWDTTPGNNLWLTAVVADGRVLNKSDGSVSFPINGTVDLGLYVADNGSLKSGKTRYRITVRFSDGRSVTPVTISK